ncbi:MAG: AI-2E family transporter [Bacteriovoracaceae bacterium]|nr:AI-2E family transporter [Bacteriovoracaceae bacterium]
MPKQPKTRVQGEVARLIFFFSVIFLSAIALMSMPRIAAPLTFAYVLYLILSPLIPRLMKLGFGRNTSLGILFIGLMFSMTYPIVKLVPMITADSQNFRYYIPKMEKYVVEKYQDIKVEVEKRSGIQLKDSYATDAIYGARKAVTSFLLYLPQYLASTLEWIFLVPLFIFFLLKDGYRLKKMILGLTPNSIFERFYYLGHQFNKKLGDYIFAKFVEASIVGIIITTGLWALDIRFALLLGLISSITNIIPYVGPIIGAVPALIMVVAEYGVGASFGGVLTLYIVANAIDIALVFPILVSKIVDIHPIMVVISVILGSQYFGLIGMIISIPFAAAVKLVGAEIYRELYATRASRGA